MTPLVYGRSANGQIAPFEAKNEGMKKYFGDHRLRDTLTMRTFSEVAVKPEARSNRDRKDRGRTINR